MRPSVFTPCGQARPSSAPSQVELEYDVIKDCYGAGYDMTPGTHHEATVYARARASARAALTLVRAGNQQKTDKVFEGIGRLEGDFRIVRSPKDSIGQRQAKLTARARATRGAVSEYCLTSLRALLGASFKSFRTLAPSEVTVFPTWPSSQATLKSKPTLPGLRAKTCALGDVVTLLGSPLVVPYANLDASAGDLAAGDKVIVDPGSSWLSEVVTVTAVAAAGAPKTFTATFTQAHDEGTVVSTMHWPYAWSTQGFAFIIVDAAAAVDPEVRRQVNEFMARTARGVWGWAIVIDAGAHTFGPFELGTSPLGTVPCGQFTFTPAP